MDNFGSLELRMVAGTEHGRMLRRPACFLGRLYTGKSGWPTPMIEDSRAVPWSKHYIVLLAFSLSMGILFVSPPGFGDEFTYWSFACDLHEIGGQAWSVKSFHDLRWPVWFFLWLWQLAFGIGLASIYFQPLAMLMGQRLLRPRLVEWSCAA